MSVFVDIVVQKSDIAKIGNVMEREELKDGITSQSLFGFLFSCRPKLTELEANEILLKSSTVPEGFLKAITMWIEKSAEDCTLSEICNILRKCDLVRFGELIADELDPVEEVALKKDVEKVEPPSVYEKVLFNPYMLEQIMKLMSREDQGRLRLCNKRIFAAGCYFYRKQKEVLIYGKTGSYESSWASIYDYFNLDPSATESTYQVPPEGTLLLQTYPFTRFYISDVFVYPTIKLAFWKTYGQFITELTVNNLSYDEMVGIFPTLKHIVLDVCPNLKNLCIENIMDNYEVEELKNQENKEEKRVNKNLQKLEFYAPSNTAVGLKKILKFLPSLKSFSFMTDDNAAILEELMKPCVNGAIIKLDFIHARDTFYNTQLYNAQLCRYLSFSKSAKHVGYGWRDAFYNDVHLDLDQRNSYMFCEAIINSPLLETLELCVETEKGRNKKWFNDLNDLVQGFPSLKKLYLIFRSGDTSPKFNFGVVTSMPTLEKLRIYYEDGHPTENKLEDWVYFGPRGLSYPPGLKQVKGKRGNETSCVIPSSKTLKHLTFRAQALNPTDLKTLQMWFPNLKTLDLSTVGNELMEWATENWPGLDIF